MKNRVLTFIIGILVGSIITCSVFLLYSKTMNKNIGFNGRMPMEMNRSGDMRPFNGENPQFNEKMGGEFDGERPAFGGNMVERYNERNVKN